MAVLTFLIVETGASQWQSLSNRYFRWSQPSATSRLRSKAPKAEDFEGILFLGTNQRADLDKAFQSRINLTVALSDAGLEEPLRKPYLSYLAGEEPLETVARGLPIIRRDPYP